MSETKKQTWARLQKVLADLSREAERSDETAEELRREADLARERAQKLKERSDRVQRKLAAHT